MIDSSTTQTLLSADRPPSYNDSAQDAAANGDRVEVERCLTDPENQNPDFLAAAESAVSAGHLADAAYYLRHPRNTRRSAEDYNRVACAAARSGNLINTRFFLKRSLNNAPDYNRAATCARESGHLQLAQTLLNVETRLRQMPNMMLLAAFVTALVCCFIGMSLFWSIAAVLAVGGVMLAYYAFRDILEELAHGITERLANHPAPTNNNHANNDIQPSNEINNDISPASNNWTPSFNSTETVLSHPEQPSLVVTPHSPARPS